NQGGAGARRPQQPNTTVRTAPGAPHVGHDDSGVLRGRWLVASRVGAPAHEHRPDPRPYAGGRRAHRARLPHARWCAARGAVPVVWTPPRARRRRRERAGWRRRRVARTRMRGYGAAATQLLRAPGGAAVTVVE